MIQIWVSSLKRSAFVYEESINQSNLKEELSGSFVDKTWRQYFLHCIKQLSIIWLILNGEIIYCKMYMGVIFEKA